jgi:tRNA (guanine-N7-)-methyltransferase
MCCRFKKRHHKRRVIQPELVQVIAQYLQPGCQALLQTDIYELAVEMHDMFEASQFFRDKHTDRQIEGGYWMEDLGTIGQGIKTEREISVQRRGLPVFRSIFIREE